MAAQLTISFKAAATHVQKEISKKLSEGQLLTLYGLYKQAVSGNCPYPKPEESVDAGIMSKWKVWNDVKGLTKQQAAVQYIATVMSYDPAWQPPGDPIPGIGTNPPTTSSNAAPTSSQAQSRKGSAKKGAHARALADLTEDEPSPSTPEVRKSPSLTSAPNGNNNTGLPPVSMLTPTSPSRSASFNGAASPSNLSASSGVRSPSFNSVSSPVGSSEPDGSMEGILYKQRDVFKGWRPRYFKLEDQVLYYYLDRNDPTPRGTMFVENCRIEAAPESKVQNVKAAPGSAGVKYYPLVISHPSSSLLYNLSATSIESRDRWINALRFASTHAARNVDRSNHTDTDEGSISSPFPPTAHVSALTSEASWAAQVPAERWQSMEVTVAGFLAACDTNASEESSGWIGFGEKAGIKGFRKPGKFITVRGEGLVNHHASSVFRLVWDPSAKGNYDTQLDKCQRPVVFNDHTVVDHLVLKGVWPTYPRDFLSLIHWRVVDDAILLLAVGFPPEELSSETLATYPKAMPQDGYVRGNCIMAGWKFKSLPGNKTHVTYIVQSDVGGKLPTSLVNSASQQQAFMIAAVDKELSTNTYEAVELDNNALTQVAKEINNRTGPFPSGGASSSTSSSALSPSSPPPSSPSSSSSQTSTTVSGSAPTSSKSQVSFQTPPPSAMSSVTSTPGGGGGGGGTLSNKALGLLLLPSALWFLGRVSGGGLLFEYRGVLFCLVLAFAFNRVIYEQLGVPSPKKCVESEWGSSKGGVSLFRFPVELKKLLRYLESKRQKSGIEINVTHVTIKAAAIAMKEYPALNGRVCLQQFYRNSERPSIAYLNSSAGDALSATLVNNADLKAVDKVAVELKNGVERAMTGNEPFALRRRQVMSMLPAALVPFMEVFFGFLGSQLGLSLPQFGIKRFPLGNCVVVTPPSESSSEMEVDVTNGSGSNHLAPVVITVGGIRVQSGYMKDKQMAARPVLHMSASVDLRCATLYEAKNFVERIQQLMRDPSLIDKYDDKNKGAKVKTN